MSEDFWVEESEEIDLELFISEAAKFLSKEKLKKLIEFIESKNMGDDEVVMLTTDHLAYFLARECGLSFDKVVYLLSLFGLDETSVSYVFDLIDGNGGVCNYSR